MMTAEAYVVRVVYKSQSVEIHEYKNKKKALQERDRFRRMAAVESAKIIGGEAED